VTSSLSQLTQLPQGPGILRLEVYGNAIVPKQKTEKNMSEKFGRGRLQFVLWLINVSMEYSYISTNGQCPVGFSRMLMFLPGFTTF